MVDKFDSTKPARVNLYPDSLSESKLVLKEMKNPDVEFFQLTDTSPRTAFVKYLDNKKLKYNPQELKRIIDESKPILIRHKEYYNRPRPAQVNPNIKPLKSNTAKRRSYPSGHAFQSYLIAKYLSKKYPLHHFSFYAIANRIANARVSVGLHYPSDNKKAHQLAHQI